MPYNNHQFCSLRNRKDKTVKCHQVAAICGRNRNKMDLRNEMVKGEVKWGGT